MLCALVSSTLTAQHECGFDHLMDRLRQEDPRALMEAIQQNEAFIQHYKNNRSNTVVTIPTVVHVVHNGEAVGTYPNLSEAQLLSGIEYLNHAFKNTGPWSGTTYYNNPMNVEFVLAKRDPNGAATTGMMRYDVSGKSYGTDYNNNGISTGNGEPGAAQATLFNDFYWNPQDYMNVWLVKKINGVDTGSGNPGVLGYATIPGTNPGVNDGLVCQVRAFGYNTDPNAAGYDFGTSPSHLNGTANHEVGHYLDLYHTFAGDQGGGTCPPASGTVGQDDDGCNDIAPHKRTNSACPAYSATGNDCGGGSNEYIHNYMNYSTDNCFQGFSADQKTRVEAAANGARSAFKTSLGATDPTGTFPTAATTAFTASNPQPGAGFKSVAINGGTPMTSLDTRNDGAYLNRVASQPNTVLTAGAALNLTIIMADNGQNNELINVYLDLNNDGDFTGANEMISQMTANEGQTNGYANGATVNISIPANTPGLMAGATTPNQRRRMRIVSGFDNGANQLTDPNTSDIGQAEDYSVSFGALVLPVDLTAFTGTATERGNALAWTTATEQNNAGFLVERSTDGATFERIGYVNGNGTTETVTNYDFLDTDPAAEVHYYRLRQEDHDGAFEYSEVISIRRDDAAAKAELHVFPNPVQAELTLANAQGEVTLFDLTGRPLRTFTVTADRHRLDVQELPAGSYLLRVVATDGSTQTRTFVK